MMGSADEEWTFPLCPPPPDWTLDWPAVVKRFSFVQALDGCPQDPVFHAEGDVLTHTRLVVEALVASPEWRAQGERERAIVFAAALLHDIGKPACTIREVDGTITSRGHARRGAQMARQILWQGQDLDAPVPFAEREAVVALVRRHGLPLWLLDDPAPRRRVILTSQTSRCDWLYLVARADVEGRRCHDVDSLSVRLDLFRDYCAEQGCFATPWPFPSAHSRFVYARSEKSDPERLVYDDTCFEVVLMSGLPGSGKDAWITANLAGWPVVSLDDIRDTLDVAPTKDQGAVIAAARAKARVLLRERQPFVWNATNTTGRMRTQLVDFFTSYGARVRIVYCETAFRELLRRNRQRARPVPESALYRLAARLDVPEAPEADRVDHVVT